MPGKVFYSFKKDNTDKLQKQEDSVPVEVTEKATQKDAESEKEKKFDWEKPGVPALSFALKVGTAFVVGSTILLGAGCAFKLEQVSDPLQQSRIGALCPTG